jgi:hypothetical protein
MGKVMAASTLTALAKFNLQFGLIGIDKYFERCEVAFWLDDQKGDRPETPYRTSGVKRFSRYWK